MENLRGFDVGNDYVILYGDHEDEQETYLPDNGKVLMTCRGLEDCVGGQVNKIKWDGETLTVEVNFNTRKVVGEVYFSYLWGVIKRYIL